jgi:DNA-binding NarL/FixJ family response regulator
MTGPASSELVRIRVAVVDDQALVRSGFVMLLQSAENIDVVGEAPDGAQALELVRREAPDVVLMDIRMPVMDGLEATRRICADENCRGAKVLILTTFDQDELVYEALHAGASGFLLKETRPQDLLDAIAVVAAGDALLAPRITKRLIARFTSLTPAVPSATTAVPAEAASTPALTDRERQVLLAIAGGRSNREIADELHIGYGTVKTHVSHLLTKLDCRDRAQLVICAYESRIAVPGER